MGAIGPAMRELLQATDLATDPPQHHIMNSSQIDSGFDKAFCFTDDLGGQRTHGGVIVKTLLALASILSFSLAAHAAPTDGALIERCVSDLKVVYKFNNDQAAQACAKIGSLNNLGLLEECIGGVVSIYQFTTAQAANACTGVSDVGSLESCIGDLENSQGFNNDQAAKACSQR